MLIRVLKNSFFSFLSQILLLLSSMGIYVLVGRKLGPEGLGQFSFVLSYIGLFTFITDFGLNLYLIREIARNRDQVKQRIGQAIVLVLLISPLSYLFLTTISRFLSLDKLIIQSIYIAGVYLLLGGLSGLFRAAFHAFEHMEYETYTVSFERFLTFALAVAVLIANGGILGLIIVHVVARLLSIILSIYIFTSKISKLPIFIIDLETSRRLLKASLPFALNILTTTVYIQADLVLLKLWVGDEAGGFYKAATSLIIPLAVIATSVNSALFPGMARAFERFPEKLRPIIQRSIRYLFILGWPMAIGIALLSSQIIGLIYGKDFSSSVLPLQILAILVPMRFINNTMGVSLTAINRQGVRAMIILLSAVFNLLLNIYMIPRWTYIGTSISTVLTEILIFSGLFISLSLYLDKLDIWENTKHALFSGLLMGIVTLLLRDQLMVISISVSAITYFLALLISHAIPAKDLTRIKSFVRSYQLQNKVN